MRGMNAVTPTTSHAARSAEIAFGIRAARAHALVRRAEQALPLHEADLVELRYFRNLLHAAAERARAVAGPRVSKDSRNIASVGLALSAAVRGTPTPDRALAEQRLEGFSQDLDLVMAGHGLQSSKDLLDFMKTLADAAEMSAARTGETVVRSRS